MLWILRQSHRWDRISGRMLGQARYQKLKNFGWKLYLNEATRPTRQKANQKEQDQRVEP